MPLDITGNTSLYSCSYCDLGFTRQQKSYQHYILTFGLPATHSDLVEGPTENKMQNKGQQSIYGGQEPVQSQPRSGSAVAPMPSLSSLQGLDCLNQASQMVVQLRPKFMTALRHIVYDIKNSMGQLVYTVTEDYNCLKQSFCSGENGFTASFTRRMSDNTGCLAMEVHRPFSWPCSDLCCNAKIEVRTASGVPMAYIVKEFSPCILKFKILNENDEEMLKISATSCCGFKAMNFKITSIKEQTQVGRISMMSPFDICSKRLHFDVHFSPDLHVKMKAAILGTCLLFF